MATERSLEALDRYTYVERDQDRRLDSVGQLESEKVDVTRMILVTGGRFEQLVERNGQLPSAEEQKKLDQDFKKLKHATPQERTARQRKELENRSVLRDLLEGFDYRLHMWGSQRFFTGDASTDSFWVAMLTFGEEWHNNHHAPPRSACHGPAWYEFDLNWYGICALKSLGLAWDIKLRKLGSGHESRNVVPHEVAKTSGLLPTPSRT